MKNLIIAAVTTSSLFASAGVAVAQYGDAVAIQRNYRGEQICPSNYVIRGNACVSVRTLQSQGRSTAERPGRPGREYYGDDYDSGPRRQRSRGEYDQGRYGGGPWGGQQAVQPHINRRGEVACPSNFVIRGGACVSIYGR